MVAIEVGAVASLIGCLASIDSHNSLIGFIALSLALVSNLAVWAFARASGPRK